MKDSNEIIEQAQNIFDDFINKKIGANELTAASRMVDSFTKRAIVKLKYNQYQSDHSEIEYLEGK